MIFFWLQFQILINFNRTDLGVQSKDSNKDSKQEIMGALCGSTVITHYNRKTYRIDDIDFSMTPLSTFEQSGVQVSF